jgi:exodeoxyribonuclease VII small subunit
VQLGISQETFDPLDINQLSYPAIQTQHTYRPTNVAAKKSPKKSTDSKPVAFESAMQELEALVARMEKGDRSLEDSLKDFERGVELTRTCQTALRDAEQKVQKLVSDSGQATLAPFDDDDEPDA